MNLCIKNHLGDKISLDLPKTHTIKQVIEELYNKNTLLKNHMPFEIYAQAVQISLNGQKLDLDRTLADYGIDVLLNIIAKHGVDATSDLDLTLIQPINVQGLSDTNFIDLQLDLPEVPEELCCPISTQIFRNPVVLPTTGGLIEKATLIKWLQENGRCPFSRKVITLKTALDLKPIKEIQEKIAEFFKQHENRVYFQELQALQHPESQFIPLPQTERQRAAPTEPDIDDLAAMNLAGMPNEMLQRRGRARRNLELVNQIVEDMFNIPARPIQRHVFFPGREEHIGRANELFRRRIQSTVEALGEYGVTENLISENWQPGVPTTGWCINEHDALVFFVTGRPPQTIDREHQAQILPEALRLSPINALREITRLCNGQLTALCKLYERGLRGEDLRNWRGDNNQNYFMPGHTDALIALVEDQNLPVNEALDRIRGTTESAARNIYRAAHIERSGSINFTALGL